MSTRSDIDAHGATTVYDAADLGRAVRDLRRSRGWTQSDLAEWLGVHRVTVAKLERGGPVDMPLAVRAVTILGADLQLVRRANGGTDRG